MPEPYVSVVHCCGVTNSFDPGYQVHCIYDGVCSDNNENPSINSQWLL